MKNMTTWCRRNITSRWEWLQACWAGNVNHLEIIRSDETVVKLRLKCFWGFVVFLSAAWQEIVLTTKFFLKGASKIPGHQRDIGFRICNKIMKNAIIVDLRLVELWPKKHMHDCTKSLSGTKFVVEVKRASIKCFRRLYFILPFGVKTKVHGVFNHLSRGLF